MTTLNAKANQAWNAIKAVADDWDPTPFYSQQEAYEEAYETGYNAALADLANGAKTIGSGPVTIEVLDAFFEGVREGLGK